MHRSRRHVPSCVGLERSPFPLHSDQAGPDTVEQAAPIATILVRKTGNASGSFRCYFVGLVFSNAPTQRRAGLSTGRACVVNLDSLQLVARHAAVTLITPSWIADLGERSRPSRSGQHSPSQDLVLRRWSSSTNRFVARWRKTPTGAGFATVSNPGPQLCAPVDGGVCGMWAGCLSRYFPRRG